MPNEKPVREQDKFMLRLPDGMRERLTLEARSRGRSMNAEVVARLRKSLEDQDAAADLAERLDRIEAMILDHDRKLNPAKCD